MRRRPEHPRTAHPWPGTACRHLSWLRAPLAPRWPSSFVPEGARSAGAGCPWHWRALGWQPELDRPVHRRCSVLAAFRGLRLPLPAPGPVSTPGLFSASWTPPRPMGGQGGQRRWGPPPPPRRIAHWRPAAAAAATQTGGEGCGARRPRKPIGQAGGRRDRRGAGPPWGLLAEPLCGWSWGGEGDKRAEAGGAGGRGHRKTRTDWRNRKRFFGANRGGAELIIKLTGRTLRGTGRS